MLCISGLNYFNHKKNIISFLSCGFSVTKISRFWDHCISGQIMNVQFFDHVPHFLIFTMSTRTLGFRWCLPVLPFLNWSNWGPKELNVIRRRGGAFYLDSLIEGARVSRCPNYEVFATSMCPPVGVDWKLLLSVHHLASSGDIWCVLLETFK